MEQRSNYAVVRDAQKMLGKEECALVTEQLRSCAAVKGALIELSMVEFVSDMGQRPSDAAVKDALI